ncbi:MAG: hypothetical protein EBY23_02815 [Actinobacteria bacterium]|nr:hypothetical protein [Actinomycetota bacterium]
MIYRALPASGHDVSWDVANPNLSDGGRPLSTVKFRWENEGWTLDCGLGPQRSQVAIRVSAQWGIQQVLLFRDLDDPDLWLATDGSGRWGEVNGAHRTDLDGCHLVAIVGSPITHCIAIRQLPLEVGHGAEIKTAIIDPEKLSVVAGTMRFERIAEHRWRYTRLSPTDSSLQELIEVDVDEFGLVLDEPEQFIRARSVA